MANEQRLIDANKLMKAIRTFRWVCVPNTLQLMFSYLRLIIRDQPTVDAVVLPCKIGDEVWGIRRSNKGALAPHRGIVSHMVFSEDMKLCIVVQHICRGEWGKKVFATYEDACAAIRERRTDA